MCFLSVIYHNIPSRTIISFNAKKVYIRFIGTHADYDKIKEIENI